MSNADNIPWRGPVAADWLARCHKELQPLRPDSGVAYLRDSWRIFGLPHRISSADEASGRFAELRDGETAEGFLNQADLPRSNRYSELARQLSGEERQAWVDYFLARKAAEMETWSSLQFGSLRAFGAPGSPGAELEWIPPDACFYLHRDEHDDNVLRGENMAYWHVRIVDPVRMSGAHADPTDSVTIAKRRPGPPPVELARAAEAMRRDVAEGRISAATLRGMKQEFLASTYGKRTTAVKARNIVLSELSETGTPAHSDTK